MIPFHDRGRMTSYPEVERPESRFPVPDPGQLPDGRPLFQKSSFACPTPFVEPEARELGVRDANCVVKGALTIDRIAAFTCANGGLVDGVSKIGAYFDTNDFAVRTELEDQ